MHYYGGHDYQAGVLQNHIWDATSGLRQLRFEPTEGRFTAIDRNESGYCSVEEAHFPDSKPPTYASYLRSPSGELSPVGPPGHNFVRAGPINNRRQVIGSYNVDQQNSQRAGYLWDPKNGVTKLQTLGEPILTPTDLNGKGWVVGLGKGGAGQERGVVWIEGETTPLGHLRLSSVVSGPRINNHGQIVGSDMTHGFLSNSFLVRIPSLRNIILNVDNFLELEDANYKAVLWENGNLYDLNDLISNDSGWKLLLAKDINDTGEIIGEGFFNGAVHAFLLTPTED